MEMEKPIFKTLEYQIMILLAHLLCKNTKRKLYRQKYCSTFLLSCDAHCFNYESKQCLFDSSRCMSKQACLSCKQVSHVC